VEGFALSSIIIIVCRRVALPTDTIVPHVVYPDAAEAVAWLSKTFGFIEHYRYGDPAGPVSGAQMHLGNP